MNDVVKYPLYLGIDGGGTKTDFALADKTGCLLRRITFGASNPNDVGFERMEEILRCGILEICSGYELSNISAFAGLAGFCDELITQYEAFFAQFNFSKISFGNDAQNAVSCCLGNDDGIIAIMGTGSIVYSKSGSELHRIGGYGYMFGDKGSGFAIGRDAILSALQFEDGSGSKTIIYNYVKEKCGGDSVLEKLDVFYNGGKTLIAKYAPIVLKACSEGDRVAADILNDNIEAILKMIKGAAKEIHDKEIRVVLCGGLAEHSELIVSLIDKGLEEGPRQFAVSVNNRPLFWGALRLAGLNMNFKNN